MSKRLSVIIPSRDEVFLTKTIDDVFAKCRGECEVVAVLDSEKWPADWKSLTERYPNLHTVHHGTARGLRAAINSGVGSAKSRGSKYVMKMDGHVMLDEGFDLKIVEHLERNWVMVPRRKRLDADNWKLTETHKVDIDYHYLSFPDDPNDWGGKGLNGKPWDERSRERRDKPEYEIDDEMASQGSAWALFTDYFYELELMDQSSYGPFWNESQEIFNKCWLSGGRCVVNKKTWYAHLHKGKAHGRGYKLPESWLQQGATYTKRWMYNEAWSKQTLPFKWLIEHFWPVPSWPENWEEILYATRKPRVVGGIDVEVPVPSGTQEGDLLIGFVKPIDGGLVIHSAVYGYDYEHKIDVVERVRQLVKDDSLDIVVNNSTLTPNDNPFRGKKKTLSVQYSFDGGEKVLVQRQEKDWLIIGPVARDGVNGLAAQSSEKYQLPYVVGSQPVEVLGSEMMAQFSDKGSSARHDPLKDLSSDGHDMIRVLNDPPRTAAALNDYLIRKFSISPQRLRGPMPIELRDFHRNDLAQLFAELGFKRGAEIGVAEGKFSEILCKANPDLNLLCVDPWHSYKDNPQSKTKEKDEFAYREAQRRLAPYPNVTLDMRLSMDAVRGVLDGSLDFVSIDGHHGFRFVMMDLLCWSMKVRTGGVILLDDYMYLDRKRWGAGVVEAVQAFASANEINPWFICDADRSVDAFFVKGDWK